MLRKGWVTVEEACYLLGIDKSHKDDLRALLEAWKIPVWKYKGKDKKILALGSVCYYSLTELEKCVKLMLC